MSPDLKIGVTFDLFHLSGTVLFWSEKLKRAVKAGAIEAAVLCSMMLEIPSGSVLWVDKGLRTSS